MCIIGDGVVVIVGEPEAMAVLCVCQSIDEGVIGAMFSEHLY